MLLAVKQAVLLVHLVYSLHLLCCLQIEFGLRHAWLGQICFQDLVNCSRLGGRYLLQFFLQIFALLADFHGPERLAELLGELVPVDLVRIISIRLAWSRVYDVATDRG